MLDAVVAATLEDVAKTNQVALDVNRWVFDRIAHPCLGRQIHHLAGFVLQESCFHRRLVFQISFNQLEACARAFSCGLQLLKAGPLQGWVVVRIHVVEPQHRSAPLQQPAAQVKADKASGSGN